VNDLTVARWKSKAGTGNIDLRASRIGPALRDLMGVELPACIWCGWPMLLVDSCTTRPPWWVHVPSRAVECFPDEGSADVGAVA
jgi:hypothetical protein